MTATLPEDVQSVFARFVTTEYTTIDSAGHPITWPVTPYYSPGAGAIDVTTGIGYPKKARDAQANPRVALLFSDPTGCGLDSPPAVLVHQSAHAEGDTKLSRSSSRCTSLDERLRGCSELVAGEYDLKRASLCEVLGRQEMREAEGVLRVGLRHPLV